jgi:hypothetical protein
VARTFARVERLRSRASRSTGKEEDALEHRALGGREDSAVSEEKVLAWTFAPA